MVIEHQVRKNVFFNNAKTTKDVICNADLFETLEDS